MKLLLKGIFTSALASCGPPEMSPTADGAHPIVPSLSAQRIYSSLAACPSSHIPLLVKSYFLAAADLFGHSGACMIDVFLAVKHLPYPSLPTLPPQHTHTQTVWRIVWRYAEL